MNLDLPYINAPSSNSMKVPSSTKSHIKEVYPEFFTDFTGWQDNTLSDSTSFQPRLSVNSPTHVKRKSGDKELLPLNNLSKIRRKVQNSLPEVVSAYEISKIHPRYREFFDQPLKAFKEKERFPAINNKSLLSVYLQSSVGRKGGGKGIEKMLNQKVFDGIFRKEKKRGREGIEQVGKLLTVYNNFS